jgi:hypothetical protein
MQQYICVYKLDNPQKVQFKVITLPEMGDMAFFENYFPDLAIHLLTDTGIILYNLNKEASLHVSTHQV